MVNRPQPIGPTPEDSVLVVIPTFNERDNLPSILWRLHEALPQAHALVVDDNSPDGTGDVAEGLAAEHERIHVLHRTGKSGLGVAYVAGFEWALQRGYQFIVEMDADGSHNPLDLPGMFDQLTGSGADVVIGSRYVTGGQVMDWSWYRQWLSRSANLYSKLALGIGINDVTAGFRVYRSKVLATLDLRAVASQGYCFQVDLTWRSVAAGFTVVEVPITFTEREIGESKMSGEVVREALVRITSWGLRRRGEQVLGLFRR